MTTTLDPFLNTPPLEIELSTIGDIYDTLYPNLNEFDTDVRSTRIIIRDDSDARILIGYIE